MSGYVKTFNVKDRGKNKYYELMASCIDDEKLL